MKYFSKILLISLVTVSLNAQENVRTTIKAIGIPLADHYPAIIAYEKYRDKMKKADYSFILLSGPNFVRAYFYSEEDADISFNVSPMVMDMFSENPNFRWVSLIHRDGNALSINSLMNEKVKLNPDKTLRKPDAGVANAISEYNNYYDRPIEFAIPSLLATHTTILYKYLKDYNKTLGIGKDNDVMLSIVKPPVSPAFLKMKSTLNRPAAFEQSLPWTEVSTRDGHGHIAWYSKDVLNHPKGHVECIIIAKDEVIKNKRAALKEVIYYIHKAGRDIETARLESGDELDEIIRMIRKHIPKHTKEAIRESLRVDIMAINYKNLNVDKESKSSFREIMNLAYEAGFIKQKIDIEALADKSFSTELTKD